MTNYQCIIYKYFHYKTEFPTKNELKFKIYKL